MTTGLGSWPGTDIATAVDQVGEVFPASPFLPELPARGQGADLVGRTLGLVAELGFEPTAVGWATSAHRSRAQRRAWALLRDDLDIAAETLGDWSGPFHVTVAGPWTLAALVGRGSGEAVLADPGACRDVAQAWLEGLRTWSRRVVGLLPGVGLAVQVDEPLLPAVARGDVRTASRLARHPVVEPERLARAYAGLAGLAAAESWTDAVVHCCAPGLDVRPLAEAGFTAVSLDVATLDSAARDRLADFHQRGGSLWLGVVPTERPAEPLPGVKSVLGPTLRLLEDLGVGPGADRITLTPACGLAGFGVGPALATGRLLGQLAQAVEESAAG